MASPPYPNAVSPPYPPQITIPPQLQKRSTDMMPNSAPAVKRRKQSMLSTTSSSHPLRQTSFPPDEAEQNLRYSPSPSVDNMSIVSGSTKRGGGIKSKSGTSRKRKAGDDDTTSLVSGRGLLSVKNARVGGGRGSKEPSRGVSTGADAEEDDEGDEEEEIGEVSEAAEKAEKERRERRAAIREALDPVNQARYDAWNAAKLNNAMVKKLVNQTLSQSVPEAVVFAVKVAAKLFAGEIIERARKVREQWLRVSIETQLGRPKIPLGLPSPPSESSSSQHSQSQSTSPQQSQQSTSLAQFQSQFQSQSTAPPQSFSSSNNYQRSQEDLEKEALMDAENRAPLLPQHLQEAFRRYKEFDGPDREMLYGSRVRSSSGAERFGVKNRRGRLFGGGKSIGVTIL